MNWSRREGFRFSLKRKRNIAMIGVMGVERNVIQDESCFPNANYDDDDDDDSFFNCLGIDCKLTPMMRLMKKVTGSFFGKRRLLASCLIVRALMIMMIACLIAWALTPMMRLMKKVAGPSVGLARM